MNPLDMVTYTLLALALISPWLRRDARLWGTLLGLAVLSGLALGRVQGSGLIPLALGLAVCGIYFKLPARSGARIPITLLLLIWALALSHHLVPGFDNWRLVAAQKISPDSLPYSLYLNFDKALVGLFLLVLGSHRLIRSLADARRVLRTLVPWFFLGSLTVLLLSFALGYIRWDPKLPDILWLWIPKMLLFTCIPEELLFRGWIQKELTQRWKHYSWGPYAALLAASVLFGLDHFAGGPKYIFLATVAGGFYGWVYLKTKRIESCIAFHFLLNLCHLVGFSYPALISAFQ